MSRKESCMRPCAPSAALRILGIVLIAAGVLLLVIFLPLRFWVSLLGVALVVLGIALRSAF